ncbi:MAG: glycoside hydrolase family 1 protein [Parcubacteria group bacterium]|jgi:beta-glucosidase
MEDKNKSLRFPKGFLWGAAISAHQVEGGNMNDWTEWEKENAKRLAGKAKTKWARWQQEKFPEMFDPENYISGRACEHYNRYEKDFDIAESLNMNAFRISIEWSRIEPKEGEFDEHEIEHYRKVIRAIRARGMEPFVTLWHFTNPVWFNEKGGWVSKKSVSFFERYIEKILRSLGEDVRFWLVINEPNVYTGFSYLLGTQPPGKKNPFYFLKAYFNLLKAYKKSYGIIHNISPKSKAGFAHSAVFFQVEIWKPINKLLASFLSGFSNFFLKRSKGYLDFIGYNYYIRIIVAHRERKIPLKDKTDLGWEICPKGIYHVLKKIHKYNLPIYITENGLADSADVQRERFVKEHLYWIHRAIQDGVDVRGYLYWSFLDNFEMPEVRGFWPRFGLIEVDYKTMERRIRPSAYEFAKICKENKLTPRAEP